MYHLSASRRAHSASEAQFPLDDAARPPREVLWAAHLQERGAEHPARRRLGRLLRENAVDEPDQAHAGLAQCPCTIRGIGDGRLAHVGFGERPPGRRHPERIAWMRIREAEDEMAPVREEQRQERTQREAVPVPPLRLIGKHALRITVHFTTQIAITREYNRHRANSMAEQSTRYCNYSKNKFDNEITINLPTWVEEDGYNGYNGSQEKEDYRLEDMCADIAEGRAQEWSKLDTWIFANQAAEYAYMKLIEAGCKPQEARAILPLDCNTELVHTAFISDWKHFFDLRALGTTGAPHPDAKVLALPLMEEFKAKGYLK